MQVMEQMRKQKEAATEKEKAQVASLNEYTQYNIANI